MKMAILAAGASTLALAVALAATTGAYAHMRELRITNGTSNISNHGKAALPQKKIDKGSKQPNSD